MSLSSHSRHKFLNRLVASRFHSPNEIRKVLTQRPSLAAKKKSFISGVHNGNFYRVALPPKKKSLPNIPKLRTPTSAPKQLKSPRKLEGEDMWDSLERWLRKNAAILILNFGSVCTLVGFTRSDVLELRFFSVLGSFGGVVYHLFTPPIRVAPLVWGMLFAAVNSFKIFEIVQEREGSVQLTAEQEERYSSFFMAHGITPKQFELIDHTARVTEYKKGEILIRQGDSIDNVYLIVSGQTRASVLGRFLTAASFRTPEKTKELRGGPSGAWIGEMALLERVWNKELQRQGYRSGNRKLSDRTPPSTPERDAPTPQETHQPQHRKTETPKCMRAMYTIVAQDDCIVLVWSHDEMEALMERSTDMRAALTRAMTSAVVAKVVNFTVSRSKPWSAWLDDWKNTHVNVSNEVETATPPVAAEDEKENLPQYPIRKFGK